MLKLLEYWREWPPYGELMRGYVGYKPLSKEEMDMRDKVAKQAAAQMLGKPVNYDSLPKWLRESHAQRKSTAKN